MRVLVSTAGSHGDVLPFIALGREFSARGHEVVLYTNPYFRRYAADAGLSFVPMGTESDYEALFGQGSEGDPAKAFKRVARHFAGLGAGYYRAMRADALGGGAITVSSSLLFAGRLLRETDGVPCATVHLAPTVIRSNLAPARLAPRWIDAGTPALAKRLAWWAMDRFFYDPECTAPLNALRAELGLPAVKRIFQSWIHESDCLIGLFPAWFAAPQPDWPANIVLTGFPLYDHGAQAPLSPSLAEFIGSGSPPVAFTAGTATAAAHGFFQASVQACESSGCRGILLSHFAQQIPSSLPPGVIHVDYAPFAALLPRLAAFIHHGGVGTTSQALRAGVPQIIRPVAYDQFDNSRRTVALGVAQEILPQDYSARTVADALNRFGSDSAWRQRCQQLSARLADGDSVDLACDIILSRLGAAARYKALGAGGGLG